MGGMRLQELGSGQHKQWVMPFTVLRTALMNCWGKPGKDGATAGKMPPTTAPVASAESSSGAHPTETTSPPLLLPDIRNFVESGLLLKAWWRRSVQTRPLPIHRGSSEGTKFWSLDRMQHRQQGNLCPINSPLSCLVLPSVHFLNKIIPHRLYFDPAVITPLFRC